MLTNTPIHLNLALMYAYLDIRGVAEVYDKINTK